MAATIATAIVSAGGSAPSNIGITATAPISQAQSILSGASVANITSYLKSYPYLFVRESDQTDYFCTICDAYLKEEQLQSHLFDGHRAEGLSEYFVQVCTDNAAGNWTNVTQGCFPKKRYLYICVVCWAKITNAGDMAVHRKTCKTDVCNASNNDSPAMAALSGKNNAKRGSASSIIQDGEPTNVISTPDIPTLMIDSDNEDSTTLMPHQFNINGRQNDNASPTSSQGSLIIDVPDTVPQTAPAPPSLLASQPTFMVAKNAASCATSVILSGQSNHPPPIKRGRKKQAHPQQVLPSERVQPGQSGAPPTSQTTSTTTSAGTGLPKPPFPPLPPLPPLLHPPNSSSPGQSIQFASNCIQCSLCGSILPSTSYMKHLREFHRVACSLETTCCPLCMGTVPLMDMTVHLAAMHGVAPQPAVNALLLWTLANNTFVMNEKTKESLKAKTLALTGGLPNPASSFNLLGNNTSFSASSLASIQTTSQAQTADDSIPTAAIKFPANPLLHNSVANFPMMLENVLPHLLENSTSNKNLNTLNLPINPLISTPPPPLQHQPQMTTASPKQLPNLTPSSLSQGNIIHGSNTTLTTAAAAAAVAALNPTPATGVNPALAMAAAARIPSFLQALLNGDNPNPQTSNLSNALNQLTSPITPSNLSKLTIENIVTKLTRNHVGPNNKESFQCLVCSKWFAVPPIKHMRGHIVSSKEERRRSLPLMGGSSHVCLVCYQIFESMAGINSHLTTIHPQHGKSTENNAWENNSISAGNDNNNVDDLPLGATYENTSNFLNGRPQTNVSVRNINIPTVIIESQPSTPPNQPMSIQSTPTSGGSPNNLARGQRTEVGKGVELDNAGRVKSGKVRKQCELCGQWSNIKWFFKHMSEVHQALFCRCCREYLPIPEQEEHRRWHAEPPYMGQKIRIEHGQPVIIDRKERASLTPIGSLASWGGSSGGMVVKAVDDGIVPQTPSSRKRKAKNSNNTTNNNIVNAANMGIGLIGSNGSISQNALDIITSASNTPPSLIGSSPSKIPSLIGHLDFTSANTSPTMVNSKSAIHSTNGVIPSNVKDTLMPKETCPVCGILITYKNLARHIKLRHKIKYKFCHKCRKLVPNDTFEEHKYTCKESNISDISSNTGTSRDLTVIDPNLSTDQREGEGFTQDNISIMSSGPIDASDYLDMNNASAVVVSPHNGSTSEGGCDDIAEISNDDPDDPSLDSRKSDVYRSNTSKTKLESLMGKEFKHPRRRCAICGYTVSYSNFKRHLRNAHPNEYNKFEEDCGGDFRKAMATLSHPVTEDGEFGVGDAAPLGTHFMGQQLDTDEMDEDEICEEDVINPIDLPKTPISCDKSNIEGNKQDNTKEGTHSNDGESSFVACKICGDHILEDFLARHMSKNHPKDDVIDELDSAPEGDADDNLKIDEHHTENDDDEDRDKKILAPKTRQVNIRECPVCNQEMRAEALIKHSKLKHKISLKWCHQCTKYLMKRYHRSHMKKHDRGENIDPSDEDEQITQSPQGNAKETRSKNNDNIGKNNDESFKDDEEEMDQTEDEDNTSSNFSSPNKRHDDGLKVKNVNELMETPIKATSASTTSKEESKMNENTGQDETNANEKDNTGKSTNINRKK